MRGLIILFLSFLAPLLLQAEPKVISLYDEEKSVLLTEDIYYFEDKDREKSIEDIIKLFPGDFKPVESVIPNFGPTQSAIWIAFRLRNNTSENIYLEAGNPLLNHLDMFMVKNNTLVSEKHYGNYLKFSKRDLTTNTIVMDPEITAGEDGLIFLKLVSDQPIETPLKAGTIKSLFSDILQNRLVENIYFGFVILMILYNLIMSVSIRDSNYFYYSMYATGMLIMIGHVKGYTFQLLWPDLPSLNQYFPIIFLMGVLMSFIFTFKFLKSRVFSPILYRASYIFYFFATISIVLNIIGYNFISTVVEIFIGSVAIIYSMLLGISAYKNGKKTARFYIVAWGFMQIGALTSIFYYLNLVPYNTFTANCLLWGSGLELLFLSIALSDKINYYKKSREISQKMMIRQLEEKQRLKDTMNQKLEQKVEERTKELKEKNRQVDILVYKASHDIKGPLRSISMLTKIGLKDLAKYPEVIPYLEHINITTTRLSQIVTDLLNLAKIKETKLQPERTDPAEIIQDILHGFQNLPEFKKMHIEINIGKGLTVMADKKLLYSIMQNFIENGIKYSDLKKSDPYLKISIALIEDKLYLKLEDNGLGIAKEHQAKIFDMFYKVDAKSFGTGLGLYLVKEAIEKMNGKIECLSEPGVGTTFSVAIPVSIDAEYILS